MVVVGRPALVPRLGLCRQALFFCMAGLLFCTSSAYPLGAQSILPEPAFSFHLGKFFLNKELFPSHERRRVVLTLPGQLVIVLKEISLASTGFIARHFD
jgi:hypothetical protein